MAFAGGTLRDAAEETRSNEMPLLDSRCYTRRFSAAPTARPSTDKLHRWHPNLQKLLVEQNRAAHLSESDYLIVHTPARGPLSHTRTRPIVSPNQTPRYTSTHFTRTLAGNAEQNVEGKGLENWKRKVLGCSQRWRYVSVEELAKNNPCRCLTSRRGLCFARVRSF